MTNPEPPAIPGYQDDTAVRSREAMQTVVEQMKACFKTTLSREATILVVNNWAVRSISTWATEGRNPDGSWGPVELFGLKLVISIYVKEVPGFLVAG